MSGFGADSFGLCGTGVYANDVLCEVIHQLEGASAIADDYSSTATVALRNLAQNSSIITSDLANIQYSVNLGNFNFNNHAPGIAVEPSFASLGPTAPVMPAASSALISDATLDAAFTRAADKVAAIQTGEERDAIYQAASMGIGLPSAALQAALRRAKQTGAERTQAVVLEQAVQEGVWKREDTKTILGLQIEQFKASWNGIQTYLSQESARLQARIGQIQANIAAEAERRGWTELELKAVLEQADKETAYAIELAKTIAMLQMNITTKYTELTIGAMQAAFSAQHYNLTGSASQDVQTSVSG